MYVSLRLRKSLNEPVVIFSVSGIILRNKSTNSEIFEYRLDSFLLSIFLKSTFLSFLISIVNFLKIKIFESPFFYCQYSRKCLIWVAGFFRIQLSGSTHFCCLFLKRNFYEKKFHFVVIRIWCLVLFLVIFWNENSNTVSFLLSFS